MEIEMPVLEVNKKNVFSVFTSPDHLFLESTEFTDINTRTIRDLAFFLTEDIEFEREKIQTIFYWVRDNIKYSVGLNADKASYTVLKGFGSCLNKTNLLIALLRAISIPAAFSIMRVKTREYFGPLGFERYRPLVSEESNHTYAQVYLNGRWIKLDCTDDIDLSKSTHHLQMQGEPVEFDGINHACLNLDPDHVILDDENLLLSLDHIFRKKPKVPPAVINIFNICMSYVRHNGKFCSSVEELEASFFEYLEHNHPEEYKILLIIEDQNMNNTIKKLLLFKQRIKN
jgi:hypothetical protein